MNSKDEIVRAQIIESAKGVFRRYGYQKVSMNDIAKSCGKGRSTLYYYFKNKHKVFEQVAEMEYLSIIEPAKAKIEKSNTIEENLRLYNEIKLKSLINKTQEYTFLLEDIKQNFNLAHSLFMKLRHIENRIFQETLTWAIEKKEIAPINQENMQFLAMTMVTAYSSLEKEMLLYGSIENMSVRLEWLVNILIKGLKYDQKLKSSQIKL
ncbi:TetR/AcrR family transcriptional regulator [Salegentibacter mishustinae]|jgi:AcrR family transcriptional regulator|uniref:TetR/AcrR family transcriptional regulator n=1 Tax=Salegentibacter mishustinae TaxID=270918 RepID=UPI001CE116C1|nr:TetR/AcrR family transcriptional regulator [Salegentibacter mishustinae]UBZ05629.1 TetR/AcrR family transcriptional regulator [Salegentibacter mishustinae]